MKNITDFFNTSSLNESENGCKTKLKPTSKNIFNKNYEYPSYVQNNKNNITSDNIFNCPGNEPTNFSSSYLSEKEDNLTVSEKFSKMNAFQLMMKSRSNVIDSSGKELLEIDDLYDPDKKEKIWKRKQEFSNWADLRGALKRKRCEEEKDEVIKIKMKKRAKRLKNLLKAEKERESNMPELTKKRTKNSIRKLSSDNETNIINNFDMKEGTTEEIHLKPQKSELVLYKQNKDALFANKLIDKKSGLQKFVCIINNEKDIAPDKLDPSYSDESTEHFKTSIHKNINYTELITNQVYAIKSDTQEKEYQRNSGKLDKNIAILQFSHNINIKSDTNEFLKKESNLQVRRKKKCKKKKKKAQFDDSSQDSFCNDNILKLWKMKIRIDGDKLDIDKNKETSKSSEFVDSDETINPGDSSPVNISSDTEEEFVSKKSNISLKIAPVFTKATPKPKLDPNILEARRQFLLSGTPVSIKKFIGKQQSFEETEFDVFPSVSHVQQKCNNPYWSLEKPKLELIDQSPLEIRESYLCNELSVCKIESQLNPRPEVEKMGKLKVLLNKIKLNNPSYPVYKSFKFMYKNSGLSIMNKTKNELITPSGKQKCSKRKQKKKKREITELQSDEQYLNEFSMWTEKYKPKCSDDILGNSEAIISLKKWLETWKNFSQEINFKKRRDSSSSEFELTDCDSRSSEKLPGNTIVLGGPCGSGKSSAVYAICEELEFNIIEINASSKRTGKKLMQELQEATQSHQVRKTKSALPNLFESSKAKQKPDSQEEQSEIKMCVLLVEDIDIVFEQDDGFIFSLTQLINTSKRPIILTTTDYNSSYVQKFLNEHEYISFLPLSSSLLAIWLQILCLVEGIFIETGDIGSLLNSNKGDIRRTILQLQFWVQSGQLQNDMPIKIEHVSEDIDEKFIDDEDTDIFKDERKAKPKYFIHKDCIRSFKLFENAQSFFITYYLNLGLLWWNIPNILHWPNFCNQSTHKNKQEENMVPNQTQNKRRILSTEQINYKLVTKLYESLLFTDVIFTKLDYFDNSEPTIRNNIRDVTDSLELNPRSDEFSHNLGFTHEITHRLIDGCIKEYSKKENVEVKFNVGLPGKLERRWQIKQYVCEDIFREGLGLLNHDRKSIALDYFPTLRTISRLEEHKVTSNTKRGNRFRSYFKDLGINCKESTIKLARSILQEIGDG